MMKNIPLVICIFLCLIISVNSYSQTQFLSPGEKTGLVLDSLIKTEPVSYVQIKYKILEGESNKTISGVSSKDFNISGQFIVIRSGKSDQATYYNLDKVLNFYIRKEQLVITLM